MHLIACCLKLTREADEGEAQGQVYLFFYILDPLDWLGFEQANVFLCIYGCCNLSTLVGHQVA